MCTPLTKLSPSELKEISPYIHQLFYEANRFREIRNFFTHLDEVFTNMDRHGMTGALKTNCGIEYLPIQKDVCILSGITIQSTLPIKEKPMKSPLINLPLIICSE